MKRIISILGILFLLASLGACVKEQGASQSPVFQIDMDTYGAIILEQYRQVAFVPVTTNVSEADWQIVSSADWCQASRSITADKGIMIAVESNTDKEKMRQAQVSVQAAGKQYNLIVSQFGYGPAIVVSNVSVGPEGGEVYMDVVSNVNINESLVSKPQFNSEDGENWIRFVGIGESTKAFATSRFIYAVATNELPDKRVAKVSVNAMESENSEANTQCVITQNSISITNPEIYSDERIDVLSVRANQYSANETAYGNGEPERLIDHHYDSYYHSPWPDENWGAGHTGTQFPVVWEFELPQGRRVDHISVMHRSYTSLGDHWRGQIGKFKVYAKNNAAADYDLVQEFDFHGNGGYQSAYFDTPLENAVWVKMEILDGDPSYILYEDSSPYIATAEVEFYDSNRNDVNDWISKIFTDPSCSELRKGVTKKDIIQMNGISPYLATNVAMPLFNGTYGENEMDFRIHSYEPYSDSRVNRKLVTQFYTSMNNPTGIEVSAGQDILVCVDQIPEGQTVSIAVYGEEDEYGPNYGGAGEAEVINQNTSLQAGINTVRVTADGMLYVMNTVPVENTAALSTFKSVKVHILPGCGTVQGYFDPARHSDERYKELLNHCTYKYFVVKGEKCMFLFHTNQLRSDWPNSIRSGIEAWDDIVRWEHELMGLDKIAWFNNHMMAVTNSNPDVYMNATNRRVQFGTGTIANIGSREVLSTEESAGVSNIWGPAHEMGHCNQMAINWRSTTESSNNLFSNYCNYKLAGDEYYKTRWSRGDKLDKLADDYYRGTPWAILGDGSYQGEDPALHMRLNWQLWNYYQVCGYKKDFFPALFAYMRDGHQLPNQAGAYYGKAEDAGACQLAYYEACCAVAKEDLTEFFDTWGFFRTIDQTYSQYGDTRYTVTDAMINASKARVMAMKLPKAAPIQYLEDRSKQENEVFSEMGYYTQFQNKKAITKKPSCSVNGSEVTLTDCDEAVAVEVRQGNTSGGELRFFSNMFSFTLPGGISLSNCSLWAVQADGTRVSVEKK